MLGITGFVRGSDRHLGGIGDLHPGIGPTAQFYAVERGDSEKAQHDRRFSRRYPAAIGGDAP
jgi:hypothetical protein